MSRWVLVLDPPAGGGSASRQVGGLSLALRLALDAQAAGAAAIVVSDEGLRPLLRDPRLRLPVFASKSEDFAAVRAPATFLVHRQLFKQMAERGAIPTAPEERDLAAEPFSVDAPYAFEPFDVCDAETARLAERALFRSLRKREDGWTSRWLNRHISLAVSRLLVKTPLTPNQVSVGILAVGLAGAALAARGSYASLVAGAFLFQMQSVLDGCDGEMSRVTYRGSLTGEWLDTVGDDVTNYGFFAGAAWGLYQTTHSALYLAAGAVTILAGVVASGLEYRYLIAIGSGDLNKYPLSAGDDAGGGAFDKIRPLFKRDTFVLLTLLAALAGLVGPMLLVFAAGAVGILASVIGAELRMARERRRGDAP